MKAGITLEAAQADLKVIGDQLQREYPGTDAVLAVQQRIAAG